MPEIEILKVSPVENMQNVKGFIDIKVGVVNIYGVKVVNGKNGLFMSLPSRKGKDEKYHAIVGINGDSEYKALTAAVIKAYQEATDVPF